MFIRVAELCSSNFESSNATWFLIHSKGVEGVACEITFGGLAAQPRLCCSDVVRDVFGSDNHDSQI